jgi:hypothetical protein
MMIENYDQIHVSNKTMWWLKSHGLQLLKQLQFQLFINLPQAT